MILVGLIKIISIHAVLLVCPCVQGMLTRWDADEDFNQRMAQLAGEVSGKYMTGAPSCIVLISEQGLLANLEGYDHSVIRINLNRNESSCDPNLKSLIRQAFYENCRSYVVQISNPSCFFPAWFLARNEVTNEKHNPRVLFLPMIPYSTHYGEEVLSVNETNIAQDVLIAEVTEGNSSNEWPITLFTNNFWQYVDEPGRTGRVYIDEWSWELGFKHNVNLFPDKVKNLQGKVLRLASFTYMPYGIMEPLDGSEIRMLLEFCVSYNCSVVGMDDGNLWGSILANGTATGIAGAVYLERADFGMSANYLWVEFWPYLEYSNCYLKGALTVLTPKPEVVGGLLTPFLPFPLSLWFVVLLTVAVSSIGLHITTKATFKLIPRMREDISKNPKFITYIDSVMRSVGMMVLQQPQKLVTGSPGRHLFTSFEVIYLVVTSAYAAELFDFLTIPRTTKPIDTVKDLAESNLIWMADHEVWVFGLVHSTDPSTKKMAANFRIHPISELIERSENGRYGVGIEKLAGGHYSEVPYITEKFIGKSRVMKDVYYWSPLVTFLQKGSPYSKRFNQFIGRLLNGGLFYAWEADVVRKYMNYKQQMDLLWSTKPVQYPPKTLTLNDLIGAFLLYSIGALLSVVIFFVEFMVKKYSDSTHTLLDPVPKWFDDYVNQEFIQSDNTKQLQIRKREFLT